MELVIKNRTDKAIGFQCNMAFDIVTIEIREPSPEEVRKGNIAPGGDFRFTGLPRSCEK